MLDLTDLQVQELKSLLDQHGFRLSAIGSPIGKVKIDQPFEPHLQRFERASSCARSSVRRTSASSATTRPGRRRLERRQRSWEHEVFSRLEEQVRLAERPACACCTRTSTASTATRPIGSSTARGAADGAFRAVYDAANYVFCGYDPWEGWEKTNDVHGALPHQGLDRRREARQPGRRGPGRIPGGDRRRRAAGYDGFATLEPHLLGGGPTGGVTGPELFPKAVAAFKAILDKAGAKYQ